MRRAALLLPIVMGACPSPEGNPKELWLAPTDGELDVKLVDHRPPDF